jgi:hypothetical protein
MTVYAIDTENAQLFGPFDSHEQADERIAGFMVELGEWDGNDVAELAEAGGLCSHVDEAGWIVLEPQTLEPGDGLASRAGQAAPGEQPVASDEPADPQPISTDGTQHVFECWAPRGGACRLGCSCSCHNAERIEATAHDDHGHGDEDGADGRDAHAS